MRLVRHPQTRQMDGVDEHVDEFDPRERSDDAAQAVDQQIPPQNGHSRCRTELYASQGQGNQQDDDDGCLLYTSRCV